MNFAYVKSIYKNNRYRVVDFNAQYYLMDVDASWLGYVFFGFNWLMPQKLYRINEMEKNDLLVQTVNTKTRKHSNILWLGLFVAVFTFVFPQWLIGGALLSAILMRVVMSKQSRKRLQEKINLHHLSVTKMRLVPISLATILKNIAVYCFFLLLMLLALFLLIMLEGYWVLSLCSAVLVFLFLSTNYLSASIGNYQIKYNKEK